MEDFREVQFLRRREMFTRVRVGARQLLHAPWNKSIENCFRSMSKYLMNWRRVSAVFYILLRAVKLIYGFVVRTQFLIFNF